LTISALVFVAIGLLSTIEATFNDIWGVNRGRNWFVRIIHYWAAITLGPLVVILAMGLAVGSHFQVAQDFIEETPVIGSGAGVWSWIHIDDAAEATVAALNAPAGIYNIAEDDGAVSIVKARAQLEFDPAIRLES